MNIMKSYVSKRGYVLIKDQYPLEFIADLKQKLTVTPLADIKYGQTTTFKAFVENSTKLCIPKMYGYTNIGIPDKLLGSFIGQSFSNNIQFNGKLRDAQQTSVDALIDSLGTGGGILSLGTGQGKTVCCIYTICSLGMKTLIVVNKLSLADQWSQEFKVFTPDAHVVIITGATDITKFGQKLSEPDIAIITLQSLSKKSFPDKFFDSIGCVVYDECHSVSSCVFSNSLFKTCSRYSIGLSATPKRSDNCEHVFLWHLGDITTQSPTAFVTNAAPPIVYTLELFTALYKETMSFCKATGQNQIQFTTMLNDLVTLHVRNCMIVRVIQVLTRDPLRHLLVLSDRRKHLEDLHTRLVTIRVQCGLFIGGMKLADLNETKESRVILATYQAFGEGINKKDLNTLLLLTPKKYISHPRRGCKKDSGKFEQIIGRIFRKTHHSATPPLIVDFHDKFSIYTNHYNQRLTFYRRNFTNAVYFKQNVNMDTTDASEFELLDKIKT